MKRLEGRVALVTGGVGGVGTAVVENLLNEGAAVIISDIRADKVAEAVAKYKGEGRKVAGAAASITDFEGFSATVQTAVDELGPVDIVVANAFVGGTTPTLDKTTPEGFRQDVADNLAGTFNTVRAVLDGMKAVGRGAIVVIGSVNGLTTLGQPAYSAAKAGLESLTRAMATEYGRHNIRANIVCPGTVQTPAWDLRLERKPDVLDELIRWYPLGRVAKPIDIARAVSFLASDDAGYISGVTLPVDGGLMAGNLVMTRELTLEDL